jgi:hypothetical protein
MRVPALDHCGKVLFIEDFILFLKRNFRKAAASPAGMSWQTGRFAPPKPAGLPYLFTEGCSTFSEISFEKRSNMKKLLVVSVAGLLILSGCARGYVLTLSDGERIRTSDKPRLERGFYYFKDQSGHDAAPVFSGRIREIAPASMASPDPNSAFKPVSSK